MASKTAIARRIRKAARRGEPTVLGPRLTSKTDRLKSRELAAAYHAGLDPATRERVQRHFLSGSLDVVVATIA